MGVSTKYTTIIILGIGICHFDIQNRDSQNYYQKN